MAGPPISAATSANQALSRLCGAGLALAIVGGAMVLMAWPGTEANILGTPEETGSAVVTVLGGLIATVGNYMVLVALIGWGVRLGNLASRPPG